MTIVLNRIGYENKLEEVLKIVQCKQPKSNPTTTMQNLVKTVLKKVKHIALPFTVFALSP